MLFHPKGLVHWLLARRPHRATSCWASRGDRIFGADCVAGPIGEPAETRNQDAALVEPRTRCADEFVHGGRLVGRDGEDFLQFDGLGVVEILQAQVVLDPALVLEERVGRRW